MKVYREEIFYLYWNNILQPVRSDKEAIKEYILYGSTYTEDIKKYRIVSNYRKNVPLKEILHNGF